MARYIAHKLPTEQREQLSAMVDACDTNRPRKGNAAKLKVAVNEEESNIGYAFPPVRRLSMLEASFPLPRPASAKKKNRIGRTYEKIKPYSFTSETMGFVNTQSQLLASLVSLLCPPENSPSRQQLDLPTADGNVIAETDEVEREAEKVKESGKEADITQSLHPNASASRPPSFPPTLRRTVSLSEETTVLARPSHAWKETFTNVMTQFEEGSPLNEFVTCRLMSFAGIIPWDRLIQEPTVGNENGTFRSDPVINLRRLAVLPCRNLELSHACSLVVRKLLKRGMSEAVLRFIKTEPVANNHEQVQFAIDASVTNTFFHIANGGEDAGNGGKTTAAEFSPLMLLYQLSDPELAARLTLSSLEMWPVDTCVDLLMLCFYHLPSSSSFLSLISRRLEQLQTYLKIIEVVENPLMDGDMCSGSWDHWAKLAADTVDKPEYVLSILLECKAFSLAWEWARVHDLDEDITRVGRIHYVALDSL